MNLDAMFRPKSIGIVGASPNATGAINILDFLRKANYGGKIFPINPRYETFEGLPCYPDLSAINDEIDAVAIQLGASRVVPALEEAGKKGVRAAVVYAIGFAEAGPEGQKLQDDLKKVAQKYNMAVAGPNCMGIMAPAYGTSLYAGILDDPVRAKGSVGLISQSGGVIVGMLGNGGRFGFSMLVSSGNEAVCNLAHYVDYMVDDPETDLIAIFSETVRDPRAFRLAAIRAHKAKKPIVALKVGRSEQAQRNMQSHSGALTGSSKAASAFFRSLGIHEVCSIDEMCETIVALLHRKTKSVGLCVGVTHMSGGQASLLLDLADPLEMEFPPLSPATRDRIVREQPGIVNPKNPLDLWGTVPYDVAYPVGLNALADQEDIDLIIVDIDAPADPNGPVIAARNVAGVAAETFGRTRKPIFLLSNMVGGLDPSTLAILGRQGVPALMGTENGLKAIRHWVDYHRWQENGIPAEQAGRAVTPRLSEDVEGILARGGTLNEVDSKKLLASFGLKAPQEQFCLDVESAVRVSEQIGFPVVVKAVSSSLLHKTDVGGVLIGLENPLAVRDGCENITAQLGAQLEGFLVAQMVPASREFILGLVRDLEFGLVLVFGAGGIMTEVMNDVIVSVPPVTAAEAETLAKKLRSFKMLEAWRGLPPADIKALASSIQSLSLMAQTLGDRIVEVDINPLAVFPENQGAIMLDGLVVLK